MQEQSTLPAFTLYQASTNKFCYESQQITILCTISGPYSSTRRQQTLTDPNQPLINILISGLAAIFPSSNPLFQNIANNSAQNTNAHKSEEDNILSKVLSKKLKNIIQNVLVKQKYRRLNIDFCFSVLNCVFQEGNTNKDKTNKSREYGALLSAMINLMSFSAIMCGLELRSTFSCACVGLSKQQIIWNMKQYNAEQDKKMLLAIQSCSKQAIHTQFSGQFIFTHFQKLTNILLDANQQIQTYILKKISEINDSQ